MLVILFSCLVIPILSELQVHQILRSSGTIVIFSTSFEEGDITPGIIYWEITQPGNVTLTQEIAHTGRYCAKIYSAIGGGDGRVPAVYLDPIHPWNRTAISCRIYFNIHHWSGYIVAITFRNTNIHHVAETVIHEDYVKLTEFVTNPENLSNPTRKNVYNYDCHVETGKWYYLEMMAVVNTTDGEFRVWFGESGKDPEEIITDTGVDISWCPFMNKFYAGVQIYSRSGAEKGDAVMYMDDLAIAENYIGP